MSVRAAAGAGTGAADGRAEEAARSAGLVRVRLKQLTSLKAEASGQCANNEVVFCLTSGPVGAVMSSADYVERAEGGGGRGRGKGKRRRKKGLAKKLKRKWKQGKGK